MADYQRPRNRAKGMRIANAWLRRAAMCALGRRRSDGAANSGWDSWATVQGVQWVADGMPGYSELSTVERWIWRERNKLPAPTVVWCRPDESCGGEGA